MSDLRFLRNEIGAVPGYLNNLAAPGAHEVGSQFHTPPRSEFDPGDLTEAHDKTDDRIRIGDLGLTGEASPPFVTNALAVGDRENISSGVSPVRN